MATTRSYPELVRVLVVAVLVSLVTVAGAEAQPPDLQQVIVLHGRIAARAAPGAHAPRVALVAARTPLTSTPTALPVVGAAQGPGGGNWLRVRLPTRPNGSIGWIPASAGLLRTTQWRIVVHRAARRADVFFGTERRASFSVVVGKPSTPTPLGSFFVVEKVRLAPGVTEGPWALPISAYSNVLQTYAGGRGEVGLHGTVGLDEPLGSASSHGCIRFAPRAIDWIAARVDAGTPVVVTR
jgi:lipoprotein-anchoring transpeptidase ErfK/SrfK